MSADEPVTPPQDEQQRRRIDPRTKSRQQPGSACDDCRKRKLRCDRQQPTCGHCADAGIPCFMRTTRPPRGPKKGHLRVLRNQIASLESKLEEQGKRFRINSAGSTVDLRDINSNSTHNVDSSASTEGHQRDTSSTSTNSSFGSDERILDACQSVFLTQPMTVSLPATELSPSAAIHHINPPNLSMMLEPPPVLEGLAGSTHLSDLVRVDLDQLYFDRAHVFAPMINRRQYSASCRHSVNKQSSVCLQYAMWTVAAALSSQFQYLRDSLYQETRKQLAVLDGDDRLRTFQIEHVQAWVLLSTYEFMCGNHQRGLISAGRAFRLIQIMRLYEIDSPSFVPLYGDFIEAEVARRTFWVAYMIDRFVSVKNGLPLTLNEQEISTRLPIPESKFQSGQTVVMGFLSEVIASTDSRQSNYAFASSFTECIVVTTIWGRSLSHKQRLAAEKAYPDATPGFWARHHWLNNILQKRIEMMSLQQSSQSVLVDPMLIFVSLIANTNVLCLYSVIECISPDTQEWQSLMAEYYQPSTSAVNEILGITEMLGTLNLFQTHPFMPIPLALCAEFGSTHPQMKGSLQVKVEEVLRKLTDINNLAHLYFPTMHAEHSLAVGDASRPCLDLHLT